MNTPERADAQASPDLPELTDERIEAIEHALFADIDRDRTSRRTRRTRWWVGGAAAAAVIVVAALIAPSVATLIAGGGAGGGVAVDSSGASPAAPARDGAPAPNTGAGSGSSFDAGATTGSGSKGTTGSNTSTSPQAGTTGRDIITSASATVVVKDIPTAAQTIARSAEAHGGYVESMSIGQSGQPIPVDPNSGVIQPETGVKATTTPNPYPYPSDSGYVTVRVPAAQLSATIDELSSLGEVTASAVNRQDVTEQTVDLQARVNATQASVTRLTQLMAQAKSVGELLAVETALADRQATLESYQAELKSLKGQVDLSSLTVTLQPETTAVKAEPKGFLDGLLAGWNGLVATLNGIVIAFGFLIPWLIVVGIAGVIVWLIVRSIRRRRSTRKTDAAAPRETKTEVDDPAI